MKSNSLYLKKVIPARCFVTLMMLSVIASGAYAQELTGLDIIKKAADAAGGQKAFSQIRNLTIKTKSKVFGTGTTDLDIIETIEFPERTKQILILPAGKRIQVLNGRDSWKSMGAETLPLTSLEKKEMRRGVFREVISVFGSLDKTELSFERREDEIIGEKILYVVRIKNSSGDFFSLHIDSDSHRVAKKSYFGAAEAGLARLEETFSKYEEVEGIWLPRHSIVHANGRRFMESEVTEIKLNSELAEDFFVKK